MSKSLELKVQNAVKKSTLSKKSTRDLISEVSSSLEINHFFSNLADEHKRLLFLHRFDFFGIENEIQIPYLHLCDIQMTKSKKKKTQESRILQHVISKEVEAFREGKNIFKNMFGFDDDTWHNLTMDIKDIAAYYGILMVRQNPNIKKLINGKTFNYKKMKESLRDFKETINLKVDEELVEPAVKSKLEKILIEFFTTMVRNFETTIESSSNIFPNFYLSFHQSSRIWLVSILEKSNISFKQYVTILDSFHINGLIENKSTMFWCENCSLENPSYGTHHGKIAPSKISRSKCLNCKKSQSYSAIFSLDTTIKEAIFSKDGLLSVYLGWLLEKEGIDFEVGFYSDEYENDFLIKKSILLECKMFKSEKDDVAINSEIGGAFSQIEEHVKGLSEKDIEIKKTYFLWNRYDKYRNLQSNFKIKFKDLFQKYHVEIICPNEMDEFIEKLKEE